MSGSTGNRGEYLLGFHEHVHELLRMGYERMRHSDFSKSDEEVITGQLVCMMNSVLEGQDAPVWAEHIFAFEEERQNDTCRTGKQRLRVDIVVVLVEGGPRPRLRFEAKRLRGSRSVGSYLGKDGLGCFLSGSYAGSDENGGMLGYVQTSSEPAWAAQIADRIDRNPRAYRLTPEGHWTHRPVVPGLDHTYTTRHDRQAPLPPVGISHVLLRFH